MLPAFVGWLAFVRFQPIDFLGRMGNSTDLLGLTRSIHSPLYGLYSRDSSLFGFLADVFMLLGVTFYFAAIGLITKPHAEFLLVEKLTPAKLVQSVLCSGLATLSVYLALRICSVKPPAVLAIVIISLATFAALDTWSQIVRLRFRLYLLALFIIFLIVAIPLQTATYWQLNSGVYSAWSVMLLLFMQVGVSRFCSLRGGRVSVILCNSMSGVLLCLLGFEVVRSMIS